MVSFGKTDGEMDRTFLFVPVTRPIFKEYVKLVVLKYINAAHEIMHLDDFAGVLLCDNCSSHTNEETMAVLAQESIRLL
jgi:hypothetical protein